MVQTIIYLPVFYFNAQTFVISADKQCASLEAAMDWAEIHAPLFSADLSDIETCGGYKQITYRDTGEVFECQPMSRVEHEYWKSEADDNYDPDAAYERHLENAGWMDQAFQEQLEAQMGCLNYWQAKAVAEGRMPD